jgi:intraflagellar transport protein 140
MQHRQHDKAVHLLSISHQYSTAVELCWEHDVQITEDMAERMTPDKGSMDQEKRAELLHRMAKLCKKQGSFQLACKKFTQAGNKLKAMKSLLKSGDTEKIIFFAGTAKQGEIYVLAGNYLQSLDWHNDPDIMKNIISFYQKAKAFDKLSSFYDACAQVEIDEYRDYEKAGGALREAGRYLSKFLGPNAEGDPRYDSLQQRLALVEKFAQVRKLAKQDPDEMIRYCEELLDMPMIENAVRVGDVFAQITEHYVGTQEWQPAYRMIERMRERQIVLSPYLDRAMIEQIHMACGVPLPEETTGPAPEGGIPGEEEMDEDIQVEED